MRKIARLKQTAERALLRGDKFSAGETAQEVRRVFQVWYHSIPREEQDWLNDIEFGNVDHLDDLSIKNRDPVGEQGLRRRSAQLEGEGRYGEALRLARQAVLSSRGGVSSEDHQWLQQLEQAWSNANHGLDPQELRKIEATDFKDKWHDHAAERQLRHGMLKHYHGLEERESVQLKKARNAGTEKAQETRKLKQRLAHLVDRRKTIESIDSLEAERDENHLAGKFKNAALLASQLVAAKNAIYDGVHVNVGVAHLEHARLLQRAGRFRESIAAFDAARQVFNDLHGSDHWRVRDAAGHHQEAKEILLKQQLDRRILVRVRSNLYKIRLLRIKGELFQAQTVADDDRGHLMMIDPRDSLSFHALSLKENATTCRTMGDLSRAVALQRRVTEILFDRFGAHPDVVDSLLEEISLYRELGDYASAEKSSSRAAELAEQTGRKDQRPLAICLAQYATTLVSNGKVEKGDETARRAWGMSRKLFPEVHEQTADLLSVIAELKRRRGELDVARELLVDAVKIRSRVLAGKPPTVEYMDSGVALARVEVEMGRLDDAQRTMEAVVTLSKDTLGESHIRHTRYLAELANIYILQDNASEAIPLIEEALLQSRQRLDQTFSVLSERQQLAMSRDNRKLLFAYLAATVSDRSRDDTAYGHILAWKGAVLGRQSLTRLATKDPGSQKLYKELDVVSANLAALAWNEQDENGAKRIEELTERREDLQSKLAGRSERFRRELEVPNLDKVQSVLPANAALVDFFVYDGQRVGQQLTAFVIRNEGRLARIELGPVAPILKEIERWRIAIERRSGGASRGLALKRSKEEGPPAQFELRRMLLEPLEPHLEDTDILMISPDGDLATLPWNALPGKLEGKYLLEERAVVVLPVPRRIPEYLGNNNTEDTAAPSLFLVGGIDFDADPGKASPVQDASPNVGSVAVRAADQKFTPLPGTKREVEAIAKLHSEKFKSAGLEQVTGGLATETFLRQAAGRHRFLHLATHGFLAPTTPGQNTNQQEMPAMLQSGLAMAGANRPWQEKPESESAAAPANDGILTALEISALDLTDVDLAVLSACETGLGKAAGGEGLLGLQRAFQSAGARTTVTSLWQVDDAATQALMTAFYTNLWDKKLDKLEALRQAQIAMLNGYDPRAKKLRERGLSLAKKIEGSDTASQTPQRLSPYYWAAFTISGDWN